MSGRRLQEEEEEELDSEVEDDYEPADQEQLAAYMRQLSLQADQDRFSAPSSPISSRRQDYFEPKPIERYLSEPNLSEPGPSGTRRLRIPPASYAPPPLPPTLPERSTSPGRDAPLVKRYRDQGTGYIDLQRLREENEQVTGPRRNVISFLTTSSKIYSREAQKKDDEDHELRQKKMQKPGFVEKHHSRWAHPLKTRERFPNYIKIPMIPKDRDREPDVRDPRFNKSIKEMTKYKAKPTNIMPTGRMGYGDISKIDTPKLRKMFADAKREGTTQGYNVGGGLEHEDPKSWNPQEVAFSFRLRSLIPKDKRRYEEFQAQANPFLRMNRPAAGRLVPRPTIYNLRELGWMRHKQYASNLAARHAMTRQQRIEDMKNRARLESPINPNRTPIMKPIREDESAGYEYETYKHDPETYLLLDLLRDEQMQIRERERAEAQAAQAQAQAEEEGESDSEDSEDETQRRQREGFERMKALLRAQQQEMSQRMQPQQELDLYVPASTGARSKAHVGPAAPVAFDPSQPSGSGLSRPAYGGRPSATQPPGSQASGSGLSRPAYGGRPSTTEPSSSQASGSGLSRPAYRGRPSGAGPSAQPRGRPIRGRGTGAPPSQRTQPDDDDEDSDED